MWLYIIFSLLIIFTVIIMQIVKYIHIIFRSLIIFTAIILHIVKYIHGCG